MLKSTGNKKVQDKKTVEKPGGKRSHKEARAGLQVGALYSSVGFTVSIFPPISVPGWEDRSNAPEWTLL